MRFKKILGTLALATTLVGVTTGCDNFEQTNAQPKTEQVQQVKPNQSAETVARSYKGEKVVTINNNKADFKQDQLDKVRLTQQDPTWQEYSNLDSKNRVGVATALLGMQNQPKEKRDDRLNTKPTGWHQKKLSDGSYLYDRSHLIGYQLSGQNDNPKNLMTGTKDFNRKSMLKYENMVDKEVEKGSYVLYEVKPVFVGDELIARGVQMQAKSMNNQNLEFNVFCFNVQDGVEINYKDGTSKLTGKK
ncbi:DNA-entry nuclease [Bacillus toyonensis]|uniref:DNA/RNA non-specific endonuclease n=1 Tax=Bacillus toyonensis TaxID=155322 RepID=UPI000BFCD3D9|nr:DNA/RNA non-specific endonuclease [Bacillus toyonensis]PHE64420.1 DNA-entry nuclease [Bacillus toyonensis]